MRLSGMGGGGHACGPGSPHATYKDKREIVEALKFMFEFTVENGQKVVYVLWYTYDFRSIFKR